MKQQNSKNFRCINSMLTPLFLLNLSACALSSAGQKNKSAGQNKHKEEVFFDEMHIYGSDAKLDGFEHYGAEELILRGKDFFEAHQFKQALPYFKRLLEEFSQSPYYVEARLHLIESYINLEHAKAALSLVEEQLASFPERSHLLHRRSLFQKGAALMLLKRYDEAALTFDLLVPLKQDLVLMIEALVDSGVAHFMRKDLYTSEYRFLKAKRLYKQSNAQQKVQLKFFHSQAGFYLAELVRLEFSAYHLQTPNAEELNKRREQAALNIKKNKQNTSRNDEVELYLGEQLETKCQFLVKAQQRFIRVIREGHVGWASASGYKIGSMYEELYDEMMAIPAPKELDQQGQILFRKLLKDKVKILLEKAIRVWQSTIDMAIRNESNNLWITKSEEDLKKMKQRLLKDE